MKDICGLIFAAGNGTRLHPYTKDIPKTVLPIKEHVSLLSLKLDQLKERGIIDIFINYSYGEGYIKKVTQQYESLNIVLIKETIPLGHGKTLLENISLFGNFKYIYCTNGDTYIEYDYEDIKNSMIEEKTAFLSLSDNRLNIQKNILTGKNGEILGIDKKENGSYTYDKKKIPEQTEKYNSIGEYYIDTTILNNIDNNQDFIGMWGENDLIELLITKGINCLVKDIHTYKYITMNTIEEYKQIKEQYA